MSKMRRLYALSHRDLHWTDAFLHPLRTVREWHELVSHLRRAQERSLEALFFTNDTAHNRIARDGFFEHVAALGIGSARTNGGVFPSGRDMVTLEFSLTRGSDVRAVHAKLVDIARSMVADVRASGPVDTVVVTERSEL